MGMVTVTMANPKEAKIDFDAAAISANSHTSARKDLESGTTCHSPLPRIDNARPALPLIAFRLRIRNLSCRQHADLAGDGSVEVDFGDVGFQRND
jgi:hypothetical protein